VSVFLIGGITLMVQSAMGIYIGKIFNKLKGRPLYVVEDRVGFAGFEGSVVEARAGARRPRSKGASL
jgi:dolichol-phosphate mannosyltransferase